MQIKNRSVAWLLIIPLFLLIGCGLSTLSNPPASPTVTQLLDDVARAAPTPTVDMPVDMPPPPNAAMPISTPPLPPRMLTGEASLKEIEVHVREGRTLEDTFQPTVEMSADAPPPPPGMPAVGASLTEIEVRVSKGRTLEDALKQVENEVRFPLSTPTKISGFDVSRIRILKFFGFSSVEVIFTSQQKADQMITFAQGEQDLKSGCPPVPPLASSSPDNCSSESIKIQGVPATLVILQNPITGLPEVRVLWNKGGISYELIGQNFDSKSSLLIEKIANSVENIQ